MINYDEIDAETLKEIEQAAIQRYIQSQENRRKMEIKIKGDMGVQLSDMLRSKFMSAFDRVSSLEPPKITMVNPLPSLEMLNGVLDNVKTAVYSSLSVNEYLPGNIINELMSKDMTLLYHGISEKITYGILTGTSKKILGSLLYYVEREYIFNYIRDRIVKPTIIEDIKVLKARLSNESTIAKEYRLNSKKADLLQAFVRELMIGMDFAKAAELLAELNQYKLDLETAAEFLDLMTIFVPRFIYDLFSSDQNVVNNATNEMGDFIRKYVVTFTRDALIDLFRSHTILNDKFMERVDDTILERERLHNLFKLDLVNGMDVNELKVANKLIHMDEILPEDTEIISKNPSLKNIQNAIDRYKEFDTVCHLDGNKLTISSSLHETKTIVYTRDDIMDKLNDPFNIFGKDREYVKTQWKFRRNQSCLTQTVLTAPEKRGAIFNLKTNKLNTVEGRIAHRNTRLNQLMNRLAERDPKLVDYVKTILEKGPSKLEYMNAHQMDNYESYGDERTDLMILAETEAMYRQVINYQEPTKPETPVKKEKSIQEVYDEIRRASRKGLGFPENPEIPGTPRKFSPIHDQAKRYFLQNRRLY